MGNNIDFNRQYIPIEAVQSITKANNKSVQSQTNGNQINSAVDFKQLLKKEINNQQLVFSKHASQRVNERKIELTPQLIDKVNNAVIKAKNKGVKDALIVSNNIAFIVNIPNNTVITTLNDYEMRDNVFTNIDGTVLI